MSNLFSRVTCWVSLFVPVLCAASDGLKYVTFAGQPTLPNGEYQWTYNRSGEPQRFAGGEAIRLVSDAGKTWEGVCGVRFLFDGLSSNNPQLNTSDGDSVISWTNPVGGPNSFGVAYPHFASGSIIDADVFLHPDNSKQSLQFLQGVITHELGHVLGLQHSTNQVSIMAGTNLSDGTSTGVRYLPEPAMRLLQDDDTQGCRRLYGTTHPVRTFPWKDDGVTEYYLLSGDRYFYSSSITDRNTIERTGMTNPLIRTGYEFVAWNETNKPTAAVAVRRFFVSSLGSHVFTLKSNEIDALRANPNVFADEGVAFFAVPPASSGACPAGLTAVSRLYNGRTDGNHRYVVRSSTKTKMTRSGWRDEGVAFCVQS